MAGRAEGKIAFVTGGASGIGAESARLLAHQGARVALADIDVIVAERVAAEIGRSALPIELNVTSESSWQAAVRQAEAALGPITALVNSAGVASYAPIEAVTEAEFRRVVDVNQLGTFLGMKSVIGSMRGAGGGSIVNVSSLAGLVGMPQAIAYCASKWAVRGMTRSAAVELGTDGIRVNSVHPGVVETPILGNVQGLVDQLIPPGLPLGRIGQPAEVAALILFLASDESSYCTGSEFAVDGGWQAS
jgi:3alpha(or 20beta)-hydroxysteroid dehydrogenase